MSEFCNTCGGYNFELIGCCSGRECGCMGQPVDSQPCQECNRNCNKEPSEQAKQDYPWFFMNEEEFEKYQSNEGGK